MPAIIKDLAFASTFKDYPYDSQKVIRVLLEAQARPATLMEMDFRGLFTTPPPIDPALAAIILTLCDFSTSLYLSPSFSHLAKYFAFHAGVKLQECRDADFILVGDIKEISDLSLFKWGTECAPEDSATLVIQLNFASKGPKLRARGPGIKESLFLNFLPLSPSFLEERNAMTSSFPRGLDIFFAGGQSLCALPRTTILEPF
ncbi:MAG: phosphonate C-P lyase system protein PhnH [Deltaproteobacteria bacterium]|jgi:alpha-D-ribose 1-methylphosphonate 5-triphosphate synthase subunit PhnH|nr:phosphonate C-P lyase system protein PhnH [Deltaproteobacteria bacterium]